MRQIPCGCWGCMSGVVGFVLAMIFTVPIAIGIGIEETWLVPGDAKKFDVIETYSDVKKFAGENVDLVSISAYFVTSDGRMNLHADYNPYVEYLFVREAEPDEGDSRPVGAGGSLDNQWYEQVRVRISQPWSSRHVTSSSSEYSYYNLGMDKDSYDPQANSVGEAVPAPTCDFATLWEKAMQRDTPRDAVATIEYTAQGYHFRVSGTRYDFYFDFNCHLLES